MRAYQQTGSLLPCIALHAINNGISFAATKSLSVRGEAVVIVVGCTGAAVAVAAAVTRRPIALSRA